MLSSSTKLQATGRSVRSPARVVSMLKIQTFVLKDLSSFEGPPIVCSSRAVDSQQIHFAFIVLAVSLACVTAIRLQRMLGFDRAAVAC